TSSKRDWSSDVCSSDLAFDLGKPSVAREIVPQEDLRAGIVTVRVKREQPLLEGITERPVRTGRKVDARAGEDTRERLHVGLRVAAVYAQRVQLHQLARVVLVDRVAGVLGVVEVDQHRR